MEHLHSHFSCLALEFGVECAVSTHDSIAPLRTPNPAQTSPTCMHDLQKAFSGGGLLLLSVILFALQVHESLLAIGGAATVILAVRVYPGQPPCRPAPQSPGVLAMSHLQSTRGDTKEVWGADRYFVSPCLLRVWAVPAY